MPCCLDQRQVPGASRIFTDYLYAWDRVQGWYGAGLAPYGAASLAAAARAVEYPVERRRAVADAMARAHDELPASPARDAMLARFRQPETVAIVAGQQIGLFGGPLLTIYKALTAIRLAGQLTGAGVSAVPVFWLASQDHDLAEINHAWVLDRDSRPRRVAIGSAGPTGREPVGQVRLGAPAGAALEAWAAATGLDAAELRECYRPESTFVTAFRALLARWFEPWGLLFLDPLEPALAPLAATPLRAAVERAPQLAAALLERSRQLVAAGYHAQVEVEDGAALLFGERDGARIAARRDGAAWRWGEEKLTVAELLRRLEREPQRFSPAALLRPLVQDELLPTAAQVCGPAEIAYLAQSAVLYRELGRRQPLVYPRVSATLLDARARRSLDKYGLTLPEIWSQPPSPDPAASLAAKLARQTLPPGLEQALANMRDGWEGEFQALSGQIAALDPTLVDFVATAGGKMRHQLEQIENRLGRALARRRDDWNRHAQHLVGSLFPERHLQERLVNSAEWVARTPSLLRHLCDNIAPQCPDHQVIDV